MLTRFHNWPELLHQFIRSRAAQPFKWGANDCCLYACDWAREATGLDLAEGFRGKYGSALSAARAMREFTSHDVPALDLVERVAVKIAARHGIAEIAPRQAQRGDIVLFQGAGASALGIIGPLGREICRAGAEPVHCSLALRAWRI